MAIFKDLLATHLLVSLHWIMSLFPSSSSKDSFARNIICGWEFFFSLPRGGKWRSVVPFSIGLHGFRWESQCHVNCFSSGWLFSGCLKNFFFIFSFQKFYYEAFWCRFLWIHFVGSFCVLEFIGLCLSWN